MGLLDLFSNEKMLPMAMGAVKKQMTENNLKFIVLELDENQEVKLNMFKEADKPVVMGAEAMARIEAMLKEQERVISDFAEENARLRADNIWLKKDGDCLRDLLNPDSSTHGASIDHLLIDRKAAISNELLNPTADGNENE